VFCQTNIYSYWQDLFIAGTDTSAEAMQWAMAELLNHPESFHKVRKEIESVTQNVRLVEESDIPNMPYLQAVVKETLRLYPPGPVTTRECIQDCKINGFDIPAKTAVAINLYAIMRDPEIWEDPNEFHPERFLKEREGDAKRMEFDFIPFGAGRRGCPGTTLAFSLMNTAVAAMVQCFDWKIGKDGKGEKVDMQSGSGMSLGMVHPLICIPVVHFNPFDE
jgi:cytochrome P450 family 705 subfamily A